MKIQKNIYGFGPQIYKYLPACNALRSNAGRQLIDRSCILFQSMVSRFKKEIKVINLHLTKEDFLAEHNKLSSPDLQATAQLMARFAVEKPGVCKNGDWCLDKVRRPFIMWLTSLNTKEIKSINRGNI